MNVELLLEVKEKILQEPDNFGMSSWSGRNSLDEACKTAHCIGGWGLHLKGAYLSTSNLMSVFGCTNIRTMDKLFSVGRWPYQFQKAYYESLDLRIRAKIAAKRIDHFIATDGKE